MASSARNRASNDRLDMAQNEKYPPITKPIGIIGFALVHSGVLLIGAAGKGKTSPLTSEVAAKVATLLGEQPERPVAPRRLRYGFESVTSCTYNLGRKLSPADLVRLVTLLKNEPGVRAYSYHDSLVLSAQRAPDVLLRELSTYAQRQ